MAVRSLLPEVWRGSNLGPLREINRIQHRLDRMFNEMMTSRFGVDDLFRPEFGELEFTPPCDVRETDTHYLLSFDLPGISKDEVKIDVRDNQLIVSGERKEEKEQKEGERQVRERYYGTFERAITLPEAAEAEKIEANFDNGVLQVAVPKSEVTKKKLIPIKTEKGDLFSKRLGQEKKSEKAA